MARVKLHNGPLERMVQTELSKRGLKFKRHVKTLPGKPDIVFPAKKVAVFVDGDFWHGWQLPRWQNKLNDFWRQKLRDNRVRDARNFRKLKKQKWVVIRIWEHQLKSDLSGCIERILRAIGKNAF